MNFGTIEVISSKLTSQPSTRGKHPTICFSELKLNLENIYNKITESIAYCDTVIVHLNQMIRKNSDNKQLDDTTDKCKLEDVCNSGAIILLDQVNNENSDNKQLDDTANKCKLEDTCNSGTIMVFDKFNDENSDNKLLDDMSVQDLTISYNDYIEYDPYIPCYDSLILCDKIKSYRKYAMEYNWP